MNQKAFTIIFVVATVILAIGIGISKFTSSNSTPVPTSTVQPSPTSQDQGLEQSLQQPGGQTPASSATSTVKSYTAAPQVLADAELKTSAGKPSKKAVIVTSKGIIEFEIYADAPKASSNFIFLTNEGFYNNLKFHRVEPGFVIQGGDPLGNGAGGPGYTFKEDKLAHKEYKKGIVAMAKKGTEPAGTGGSQFFIMLEDTALPNDYVIFGEVIKGQEVVDQIKVGDVMTSVSIENLK